MIKEEKSVSEEEYPKTLQKQNITNPVRSNLTRSGYVRGHGYQVIREKLH
jgi:hypothetical protein